jgi:hypothetical protein
VENPQSPDEAQNPDAGEYDEKHHWKAARSSGLHKTENAIPNS